MCVCVCGVCSCAVPCTPTSSPCGLWWMLSVAAAAAGADFVAARGRWCSGEHGVSEAV